MNDNFKPVPYVFVIDTNKSAKKFASNFCLWVTGLTDGYADTEYIKQVEKEKRKEHRSALYLWLQKHIMDVPDQNDDIIYFSTWPNPEYFNDGFGNLWHISKLDEMGILTSMGETSKVIVKYNKSRKNYYNRKIQQFKIDMLNYPACDWSYEIKKCEHKIKYPHKGNIKTYPAYQSIAIFLDEEPPDNIIEFMKRRAKTFDFSIHRLYGLQDISFRIEGFRVIKLI